MFHSKLLTLSLSLLLLVLVGCGSNKDGLGTVTGTLLIDGKPAPAGVRLEFDPVTKGVRGSTAITNESGQFEAIYSISKNGVRQGECVVKLMPPDAPPPTPGKKPKLPFPEKYYEEIIQVDIGPGDHSFELEISRNDG